MRACTFRLVGRGVLQLLLLLTPGLAGGAAASPRPETLARMPTVDEVVKAVAGKDPVDTAVEQVLVFTELASLVHEVLAVDHPGRKPTPAELAFKNEYFRGKAEAAARGVAALVATGMSREAASTRIKSLHGQRLHEGGIAIKKRWPHLLARRNAIVESYRAGAVRSAVLDGSLPPGFERAVVQAAGVVLAYLLLMMWLMARPARLGNGATGSDELPPELREVSLFRISFPLFVESGSVVSKEPRTGFSTTTTTSGGGSYMVGNQIFHRPTSTSTTTSSWHYNLYRIALEDGRPVDLSFEDKYLLANPGDQVSLISSPTAYLVTRNHTTGQTRATGALIRLPSRRHWLNNVGPLAAAVALLVMAGSYLGIRAPASLGDWGVCLGAVAALWLALVIIAGIPWLIGVAIINRTANKQFRMRYLPALRQFLDRPRKSAA